MEYKFELLLYIIEAEEGFIVNNHMFITFMKKVEIRKFFDEVIR